MGKVLQNEAGFGCSSEASDKDLGVRSRPFHKAAGGFHNHRSGTGAHFDGAVSVTG